MSDTIKQGKRSRIVSILPEDKSFFKSIHKRHSWGQTEKYLRRNRKIWTRLLNKCRRRVDSERIKESQQCDVEFSANDVEFSANKDAASLESE